VSVWYGLRCVSMRRRLSLFDFGKATVVAFMLVANLLASMAICAQEKNPYGGDAKAAKLGESQFRINCAFCHGLGARGGGRGPDLPHAQKKHGSSDEALFHTSIGAARSVDSLIESARNPNRRLAWGLIESTKEFPQEYLSVTVVTAKGEKISGVVLNEDNFSVQMMDTREQIRRPYLQEPAGCVPCRDGGPELRTGRTAGLRTCA
jgi:hypothetical protein